MKKFPLVMFAMFLSATAGFACSIFTWSEPGGMYFCGNEDWTFTDPVLASEPADGDCNGYVAFGWKRYYPRYVQAGINSKGLCFDIAVVPGQTYVPDPSLREFDGDLLIHILKTCGSVDEALRTIRGYNFSLPASEHVVFADASGRSCVVEYNGGRLRIVESDGGYLIATNFHRTDPSLGWYPCGRYAEIERRLKAPDGPIAVGTLRDALEASRQEGAYPTIYSYVADLVRMELHVYFARDYSRPAVFSIPELLRERSAIDLPRRFGKP